MKLRNNNSFVSPPHSSLCVKEIFKPVSFMVIINRPQLTSLRCIWRLIRALLVQNISKIILQLSGRSMTMNVVERSQWGCWNRGTIVVVWDERGEFVFLFLNIYIGVCVSLNVEALASRPTLLSLCHNAWSLIVTESNCSPLISVRKCEGDDTSLARWRFLFITRFRHIFDPPTLFFKYQGNNRRWELSHPAKYIVL